MTFSTYFLQVSAQDQIRTRRRNSNGDALRRIRQPRAPKYHINAFGATVSSRLPASEDTEARTVARSPRPALLHVSIRILNRRDLPEHPGDGDAEEIQRHHRRRENRLGDHVARGRDHGGDDEDQQEGVPKAAPEESRGDEPHL